MSSSRPMGAGTTRSRAGRWDERRRADAVPLDVDNTLLDNDCLQEDIGSHREREFGAASRARYWAGFEALREQLGYADYLGALQRFRAEAADAERSDPRLLLLSSYLLDYPFAQRLYPDVLAMLAHLNRAGPPPSYSPMAMQSSSRARSSARACGMPWREGCSSTSTRKRCLRTSCAATRPSTTCWWTTSCASCRL